MNVGSRGIFVCLVLGAATLHGLHPTLATPSGDPEPTAQVADETQPLNAVLFFVSYRDRFEFPVSPTEVRQRGSDVFVASARSRGERTLPYSDVVPLLRDWRVRSSSSFSQEFLNALISRFGCRQVLIADLILYADRLLLSVRWTDAGTGRLIWLETVEGRGRTLEELSEKWMVD
ncbi:hypothetical protein ACFL6M_07445, partial [Candidatus Eisenbacteria bacterium]